MPVTVRTVFGGAPLEVGEDEAASLEAQGLLIDGEPEPAEPEPDVEVIPVFTGVPMAVSPAEAAALEAQGLLIEDDPAEAGDESTPPGRKPRAKAAKETSE